MKTFSLYNKLIIYFLAVSLLPLAGVGWFAYYNHTQVVKKHTETMLSFIAVETAFQVERQLMQHQTEVKAWSRLPHFLEALTATGEGEPGSRVINSTQEMINQLIDYYPMYDLLLLVDKRGKVLCVNSRTRDGWELDTRGLVGSVIEEGPWFEGAVDYDLYRSPFHQVGFVAEVLENTGECLTMAVAIRDATDAVQGFLFAYLNWAYIQDVLNVAQAAHAELFSGKLYMVETETNRLIAHQDQTRYGMPLDLKVDLQKAIERNPTGIINIEWPEDKTISYAQVRGAGPVGGMPWLVCVEAPNKIIYRQSNYMRLMFVLIPLVSAVVIIIVVYFISRRFSDPLMQLVKGAQAIADGDMDVEMPVNSVDEIGVLANTFNQMLDTLRQRDEALRMSNLQLEEANRLKSEFLANMSHELRTPMNSIIGFTTLVLQKAGDQVPDKQRDNLVKVRKNALVLLKLLNSILDLSKIEAGSMEVAVERFPLDELLEACAHTMTPLLSGRKIELLVQPSLPTVEMFTDRQKLQQIIINLLGNAVKFTEQGYIRCGFEVVDDSGLATKDETQPEPWVRLWIEDTGIGILEKDQDLIFSEFRQVDGSPSRKYGGTGLGLAISKKLAKLLGGDILVKSEFGFGSTFTVVIPARHRKAEPLVRDEYGYVMPEREAKTETTFAGGEAPADDGGGTAS